MGSNRAEVNLGHFYTTDGEWKLLYQCTRRHSLQECKHRHAKTCSGESSLVPVTFCPKLHYIICLLTFRIVINILHYVWGKNYTETNTQ
jgi:hypothetical protein